MKEQRPSIHPRSCMRLIKNLVSLRQKCDPSGVCQSLIDTPRGGFPFLLLDAPAQEIVSRSFCVPTSIGICKRRA
jgi:hypothetical protein